MNIELKRAIAQKFDPTTDYSNFDEAEVDGAFEATLYQLLQEPPQNVDYSELVERSLAPHIQKLDAIIAKLDFGEPIKIEGDILGEQEYGAIASDISLDDAIEDWQKNMPDKVKDLIGNADS